MSDKRMKPLIINNDIFWLVVVFGGPGFVLGVGVTLAAAWLLRG